MCWTTAQRKHIRTSHLFDASDKLTFHSELLLDVLEVVGILAVNYTGGSLDGHSGVTGWLLLVVTRVESVSQDMSTRSTLLAGSFEFRDLENDALGYYGFTSARVSERNTITHTLPYLSVTNDTQNGHSRDAISLAAHQHQSTTCGCSLACTQTGIFNNLIHPSIQGCTDSACVLPIERRAYIISQIHRQIVSFRVLFCSA
jgi:hypothetical protein